MSKQNFNEKLTTRLKTHSDFLEENGNPFWDAFNAALE